MTAVVRSKEELWQCLEGPVSHRKGGEPRGCMVPPCPHLLLEPGPVSNIGKLHIMCRKCVLRPRIRL